VTGDETHLARQLDDLREQQRAISGVLHAVARSTGLQPVLDEIVEAGRRLCDADYGALYLLDGGLLRLATYNGEPGSAEYDRHHPHSLDRTTGAGRTAVTGEPVHIPDILTDPDYVYAGPAGYRALLGMPIKVDKDLIGVVILVRREPQRFSDGQIALVETFADQAAIALENARLLDAVERQREELSRFLSPQVAELVTSEDGEKLLAGHRAYISCLFSDLRGFTSFAETAAPEELLDVLRTYHAALGQLIPRHEGTLEHFAGDGVMVFFNDPLPVADHELQAVRLALAAQERLPSSPTNGESGKPSSVSGSGSRPDTPRLAGSASRDATTTAWSARWRTLPLGSARTPRPARFWSAPTCSRLSRTPSRPCRWASSS
jgi:GAF domain-containing protein